jgi:hypothetical protein
MCPRGRRTVGSVELAGIDLRHSLPHTGGSRGKITSMKNPNLTPSRILALVAAAALVIFVIARRRDDGVLSRGEWLSDSVGPDDLAG